MMNRDILAGSLKQIQGRLKIQWGNLRAQSSEVALGMRLERQGLIQKESGFAKDRSDRQLRFFARLHKGGLLKNL
jgi:uncharacterized protein YjbJ (UPF0337 family)